jgi:hypothetical protein
VNVDSNEIRSLPVRPAGSGSDGRDGLGETGWARNKGWAREQVLLARIDWTKHAKSSSHFTSKHSNGQNTIKVLQIMSSFSFPSTRLGGAVFKCLNSGASFDA